MIKIAEAIHFAKLAHDGQLRKGGTPYIEHPMRVMFRTSSYTMDEDLLCAAVLHDVIEDTKYDFTDINMRFGERVANLVMELTNVEDKNESRAKRIAARNDKYFHISDDAKVVKMCDRMDNLRDLSSLDSEFAKMYLQESKEMVESMRYGSGNCISDIVDDLEEEVLITDRRIR